jgi:hypothetical protein
MTMTDEELSHNNFILAHRKKERHDPKLLRRLQNSSDGTACLRLNLTLRNTKKGRDWRILFSLVHLISYNFNLTCHQSWFPSCGFRHFFCSYDPITHLFQCLETRTSYA